MKVWEMRVCTLNIFNLFWQVERRQYWLFCNSVESGTRDHKSILKITVADPHHVDAVPDPCFHFDAHTDPTFHLVADLDSTYYFDADPDPYQRYSSTTGLQNLHDSIVSVHGPPWLLFEPPQLLDFEFDQDLEADPAFQLMRTLIRLFTRIRIRHPKMTLIHPEPQSLQEIVLPFSLR